MFKLDHATAAGGIAVLGVHGEFDLAASTMLPTAVDAAIRDGATGIVVDFSETTFVDASGLGTLLASQQSARQAGVELRIAGPSRQLRQLLDRTFLSGVVEEVPVPVRTRS